MRREEITVQIDWEGTLGLEVGVNPQTGMVMVTKVRATSAVRARAPSVKRGAEIVAVNAHRLKPFPAHKGGAALGDRAQLRAYMAQTRSVEQGAITDAEVSAMWATIDVNGDGSVTMAEFLETMANAVLKDVLGLIGRTPRPHTITFGVDVPIARVKETAEQPAAASASAATPASTPSDAVADVAVLATTRGGSGSGAGSGAGTGTTGAPRPEGVVRAAVMDATAAARAASTGSFNVTIAEGGALGLAFSVGSSCALTLSRVPRESGRVVIENSGVSLEEGDALLGLNGELFPRFALGDDDAGRSCVTRAELAHAMTLLPLRAAFAAHLAKKKKGGGKKKKMRKPSAKRKGKEKGKGEGAKLGEKREGKAKKRKSGKGGATKKVESGVKEGGKTAAGEEQKEADEPAGKKGRKKKRKATRKGAKKGTGRGSTGAVSAAGDASDGAVDERTDDAIATLLLAHFAPRADSDEGGDASGSASGDSGERWVDASMLAPFQQMVLDATLEKIGAAERPLTLTFTRAPSFNVVGSVERVQARLRGASMRRSVVARRAHDALCAAAAAATFVATAAAVAGEAAGEHAAAAAAKIRAQLEADAAREEADALAAALAHAADSAVASATAAVAAADSATKSATARCAAAAAAAAPAPATTSAPSLAKADRPMDGSAATEDAPSEDAPPALALKLRASSLLPPSFPYDGSDEDSPAGAQPRLSTAERALERAASQAVLIPAARQQPELPRSASGTGADHAIPPTLGSDVEEQRALLPGHHAAQSSLMLPTQAASSDDDAALLPEALSTSSPPLAAAAATATARTGADDRAPPNALPLGAGQLPSPVAATATYTNALPSVDEPQRATGTPRSLPSVPALEAQPEASQDVSAMLRAAEEQSAALKAELALRAGELAETRKQLDAAEAAAAAGRYGSKNNSRSADVGPRSPGETFLKQRQDDMIAVLAVILERQSKSAVDSVRSQRDARDAAWRGAATVIQCAARCHLATRAFYRRYERALSARLGRQQEEQQRRQKAELRRQQVRQPLQLPAPSSGSQADRAHRAAWSATTAVAQAQTAAHAAALNRRIAGEVAQLRAQLEEQKRDIAARDALLIDRIGTARVAVEPRAPTPLRSSPVLTSAQRYRSPFLSAERRRDSPEGVDDARTRSHSSVERRSVSSQVARAGGARPHQLDCAPPAQHDATFNIVAAFKRAHAELTARDALLMDTWQREMLSIGAVSIAARHRESATVSTGTAPARGESAGGAGSVGENPGVRIQAHVSPRQRCRRIAESETWGRWLRAFEQIERRAALRIVW